MRTLRRLTPAILLVSTTLLLAACDSVEERAEKHYQNAVALIAEGDVDRAMVELRNVFDLNSTHEAARRTMAELQLERGNKRGAYRQYLRLAEAYPEDLDSRIMLSEIAFDVGDWEELKRHGVRAAELAPEDAKVQIITLLLEYRAAIEQDDASMRRGVAARAIQAYPESPDSVLLRNILMDDAIRESEFTAALSEIDWLIGNDPENTRYYQERLRVLAMLGDTDGIEEQLRELIDIFPDDSVHKATLIRFYVSRRDLDGAETFLRELSAASGPDESGPAIDLIRFLVEFRDSTDVRAEIDKALAERTDTAPIRIVEAAYDFSQGNQSEAITTLQDLLANSELSELGTSVKITLAKMLAATGNEVGARTYVEEVLAAEANNVEALKMQAGWQIEVDDTNAAISALRVALDQSPEDAEAMSLLANAYFRAGQSELARDYLAQAVGASGNAPRETLRYARLLIREESYLPAEDILLATLRLEPSNVEVLVALGRLYLRMEDFGRARSVVDALRRLDDSEANQAANGIEAERISLQRGNEDAMSFLEDLADESDATLATRIALVRARLNTGDQSGALALIQELKQQNPGNEALDAVMAVVQTAIGDFESAAALYRGLLERDPMRPDVWRQLSQLQLRQGDRDGAKSSVEEGLTHTPDDANLLWARASFLERDGDIDSAIEIYETLYEINSSSVVVANNLASLLATYRDDADSLNRAWIISRRLRDADVPALQDTYGWILHRRGSSEEALPYLEAAARGLPRDPIVQYHLAQVYFALDRSDDAIAQLRKAVEIAGPTDTRRQIEEARATIRDPQNAASSSDN